MFLSTEKAEGKGGHKKLYETYVFERDSTQTILNDYLNKGDLKLVVIFTEWCGPCHQLMDTLNTSQDVIKYLYKTDIVPIALNVRKKGMQIVDAVAQNRGWKFHILYDELDDIKNSLRISEVPRVMIINSAGQMMYQHDGFVPSDFPVMMRALRTIYKKEYPEAKKSKG